MFQFFTEDYAGFSAPVLNWFALVVGILVALLILFLIIKLLRGSSLGNGRRGRHARLAVTDAASIGDDRRKLVLIRRDNVEHLILIGGSNDLVIETDIIRTAPQQTATRTPTPAAVAASPAPAPTPTPVTTTTKPDTPPAQPAVPAPVVSPAPKPAAAPTPAPTPAPAVSSATKVVAAATVTGAAIAATPDAESKDETDKVASDASSTEPPEVSINPPAPAPKVTPPESVESNKPLNSVEEMDALLNEITTEK